MMKDLLAQCGALRGSCGLWQNPARAPLILTGQDRVRLLNGLVTCEVNGLEPSRDVYGFFVDVKGHILADVVIRAGEDSLWLELPATVTSAIAAHIENYILADRVEVQIVADRVALTLIGPSSTESVVSVLGDSHPPIEASRHVLTPFMGHEVLFAADGHFGVPATTLWSPAAAQVEIRQSLLAKLAPEGLIEVGSEAIEIVRVEEGRPCFGIDYGPDNLPQETGLEDTVSYSKGCYLGQEVVARLHYRGQAARSLRRLECQVAETPKVGSQLFLDERPAGTITSAVIVPEDRRVVALAMLQRRATEQGTELQLEGGGVSRVV